MNNSEKIILDLCGGTGSWGKPYQDAGYKVYNITLPEYNILDSYIDNNVIEFNRNDEKILQINIDDIYGILAAPPCTMFSFARTAAKIPRNLHQAMETVIGCLKIIWACTYKIKNEHQKLSPLKFWALENPFIGSLKWFLGKPAMVFQPYEFGHPYKKRTALWGNFNEPKKHIIALTEEQRKLSISNSMLCSLKKFDHLLMPEIKKLHSLAENDPIWKNKNLRQTLRAITPSGFAKAFFEANQ